MENVLTRLSQLPILPCTIAIANVRKFLHMSTEIPSSIFSLHFTIKSETRLASITLCMLFALPAAQVLA